MVELRPRQNSKWLVRQDRIGRTALRQCNGGCWFISQIGGVARARSEALLRTCSKERLLNS
jgi:hypothetical protein